MLQIIIKKLFDHVNEKKFSGFPFPDILSGEFGRRKCLLLLLLLLLFLISWCKVYREIRRESLYKIILLLFFASFNLLLSLSLPNLWPLLLLLLLADNGTFKDLFLLIKTGRGFLFFLFLVYFILSLSCSVFMCLFFLLIFLILF